MVQSKPYTVLVIGDARRFEFHDGLRSLAGAEVFAAETINSAAEILQPGSIAPDAIVLVQAWPGQFTALYIASIRRLAPLAPLLIFAGSWCEADPRACPAGVPRIAAHQWASRVGSGMAVLAVETATALNLPATTTAEDLLLHAAARPLGKRHGEIAVVSDHRSAAEVVADACRLRGYSTTCLRSHRIWARRPADERGLQAQASIEWHALIWDTASEQAADPTAVELLRQSFGNAPVIALLDFPRSDEIDRARRAGLAAIIAKPLLIEDLYWQLDRVMGAAPV